MTRTGWPSRTTRACLVWLTVNHLPYPIETALTPPALRINKIDIGMRPVEDVRRGTSVREVPAASAPVLATQNPTGRRVGRSAA